MELTHKFVMPIEITGFTVNLKHVVAFQFEFSHNGVTWHTYYEVRYTGTADKL